MEIPSQVRYSPFVRRAARTMLRPFVAKRRLPGTPLKMRFPAWQHLGMLPPGGMNRFDPEVTACVRQHVRPSQTALDVGANVGFYSLLLAHLVGPSGSVHAFEPDPQSSMWLLENIRRNGLDQVRPWLLALSSTDGVSELYLDLWTSCSTSLRAGWQMATIDHHSRQRLIAATTRLDSIDVGPVDFIKIDVEGAELSVLAGARETLLRSHPKLLIEVLVRDELEDVVALLADLGYTVGDAKTGRAPDASSDYSGNIIAMPLTRR